MHWLIAILIMIMLASGMLGLARAADADPAKIGILRVHIIVGLGTFALLAIYSIAALTSRRPSRASSGHAALDALATLVHIALPLCALVMIASGFATVWAGGLGEIIFGGKGNRLPDMAGAPSFHAHAWAALVLLGLLALHILGSLYHQLVLRDRLFSRMALWGRKSAPEARDANIPAS